MSHDVLDMFSKSGVVTVLENVIIPTCLIRQPVKVNIILGGEGYRQMWTNFPAILEYHQAQKGLVQKNQELYHEGKSMQK